MTGVLIVGLVLGGSLARLSSLRVELRALARPSPEHAASTASRAATELRELGQLTDLGDDVLRRLVATPRPSSLSRA
jgi:hypothetical protein